MNGMEVCARIRAQSSVPILIMTAHAVSEQEIAEGLDIGADEYMLKPLGSIEFVARVRALLRRAQPLKPQRTTTYEDGYLSVDLSKRRVRVNEIEIRLTPTEFSLLATFVQNSGEVLTFQMILPKYFFQMISHYWIQKLNWHYCPLPLLYQQRLLILLLFDHSAFLLCKQF